MENTISAEEYAGSCCFLNMTGDITLVWNEKNRDKILEVIRKKMDEGYTFFTTKKFGYKRFTKKIKVSEKNIDKIEEIVITDEQYEKMVDDMNDRDIAKLVRGSQAELAKRTDKADIKTIERAKRAEDVMGKDSVAIRPIQGG